MANALRKGWLGNFPRLTAPMFNADKPNSTSTAKRHLRQTRQTSRSRKWNSPPVSTDDNLPDEPEYFNDIFAKVHKSTELLNSSDMPIKFPYVSYRGFEYLLISVFRGYIHAEPLANCQKANLTAAYRATYKFFADLGHKPQFQMLDNEDSDLLRTFFTEEAKVVAEYVTPNTHRRNRAERSIQD